MNSIWSFLSAPAIVLDHAELLRLADGKKGCFFGANECYSEDRLTWLTYTENKECLKYCQINFQSEICFCSLLLSIPNYVHLHACSQTIF